MNNEIVVIGCGVSGLTTGLALLQAGYSVRIMADKLPFETVSALAPAVWFPYNVLPIDKALVWGEQTRNKLLKLATTNPRIGIYAIDLVEFYTEPTAEIWWAAGVPAHRRLKAAELPKGYVDGTLASVPMIETPLYLPWLLREFARHDGEISLLKEPINRIDDIDAPIVVNCSGLRAHSLCQDEAVYPVRAMIARVENPGIKRVTTVQTAEHITYIIPRRHDVILGGTSDKGVWDEEVDPAVIDAIIERCTILEPSLHRAPIIEKRVGLRPGRTAVRLEVEQTDTQTIVHNYGHGGAGYTISWGCASDVVGLVKAIK